MLRSGLISQVKWVVMIFVFVLVFCSCLHAQSISIGAATTYDDNIFDIYNPLLDRITQFQIDLSKDWDLSQTSLSLSYTGSVLLFRDLTARNYHTHTLLFNTSYQLEADDNDQETSSEQGFIPKVNADSAFHFLYGDIEAMSQSNKEQYAEWNNSMVAASIMIRQPLGLFVSVRPAYGLSYHDYSDLAMLTNIQNSFSFYLGTDILEGSWIVLAPTYGIKSYPISRADADTILVNKPGPGKGSGNSKKVFSYNLPTPAVRQFSLTFLWKQKVDVGTDVLAQYIHFATPSTEARVIPELRHGFIEFTEGFTETGKEIFDDHFSFSGDEIELQVQQSLLPALILTLSCEYQDKLYTYPAVDLADSVIASNRQDYRTDISINLSKAFEIGKDKNLKAQIEYRYLQSNSNAVYFDFRKNAFMISLEYSF